MIVHDEIMKKRVDYLKNFGIKNETEVIMPGINGKLNELQAAMGILNIKLFSAEKDRRRSLADAYREGLSDIVGVTCFTLPDNVKNSEQYFIIRVDEKILPDMRDKLYFRLRENNVYARRYFYPLCSEANCYRSLSSSQPSNLPNAHRAAREVLALPYYGALGTDAVYQICDIIENTVSSH